MIKEIKSIRYYNGLHGFIVVFLLYLEKISWFKILFKIIRIVFIRLFYNCEISPKNFNSKEDIITLRLPHPFLIIIHPTARIGRECVIFHNTTLGIVEGKGLEIGPRIGSNVYIGCGATLLGDIIIEDGVKVGANTLVLRTPDIFQKILVGIVK